MVQSTSQLLFQLPEGIVADRIGRKNVIVFGTGLMVVVPVLLLMVRSWIWVIQGMAINAVASLYSPAFNTMIAESLPTERSGTAFRGLQDAHVHAPDLHAGGERLLPGGDKHWPGVRVGLMLFIAQRP